MPSFDKNIYFNPQECGLEIVGELEFLGGYEFDTFVVWREKATGRLGYGRDSGCSCPCPFEAFEVEDIEFDDPWRIAMKIQEATNEKRSWGYVGFTENDVVNLIDKVVNA
ncbi:hypothetical protein [Spirillospora sp. NPDC047279]|uniref:DUF7574 domain-containing protein n=1 Tax=Spirillospora sp. NPDC047279 TaxID=3155478 RepID=UPI0033EE99CE